MVEWHVTPDYIVNNWTDELLDLMVSKLVERKQRETQAMQPSSSREGYKVPDKALFAKGKNLIKVVKK